MGKTHDDMATKCGDQILNRIRSGDPQYSQFFSASIYRTADWGWPRPDYVCFDPINNFTYAIEFKPTNQSKREYLCGLGQSLAYLQKHMYSGLIVPTVADDGFPISDFINKTLQAPEFANIGVSLFEYDPSTLNIRILRAINTARTATNLNVTAPKNDTFWCWWRDISHYELFDLLSLSFNHMEYSGDIYTKYIFPKFWKKLSKGKTKTWEGKYRKPISPTSKNALKQNYKIPLNQLDLWSPSTGKLTELGLKLLKIGKLYGANSKPFCYALTYLILVDGKHLDLINRIDSYQKSNVIPNKSTAFLIDIETYLQNAGCIGPRKPSAKKGTTTGKPSYIRDEPKLWNKLGLLEKRTKSSYFFPNKGYHFNWSNITTALIEGQSFLFE